ncbi:MAG: short-chain dehydrogenase/reductase [Chthonomonadales bacterium]|nr:short-chain dehydrogenase/reductase [Chthonomonadales bacterium]
MAIQDLSGKVIVITGASSGFGKGAALQFAAKGAHLVLAARRGNLLDELVTQCEAQGVQALAVPTDVSQQAEVESLAQKAFDSFRRIDVWINNAGSGTLGLFEDVPLEEHVQVIETDLLGTLYGSYYAMQRFKQQGSGILINVASLIGKIPAPYFASYTAAKHGVVGLSAALRQELDVNKIEGIRVCTVMPTSMDTPFFEHAADHTGHQVVPIPPVYEPDQVVEALVSLAGDPKDEVAVGGAAGTGFVLMHNLFPGLTEHMMAKTTDKTLKNAASAEDTQGSLKEPMATGTGVTGGWKQ